ncbi:ornithine cyclodeaminase [Mesorhizobium sp.]|uniref:ornithine cyclodeaminase family protein n=1 Tax=Mesorhizobium sp. TaxID=1871066 RepID=UPI000FE79BA7|nr:ornithine cyclodeaminase [Mesorhizobium sp.]RWB69978.1 MAG: ornithine cyclodeaminase [Mesorhizobium sp.]
MLHLTGADILREVNYLGLVNSLRKHHAAEAAPITHVNVLSDGTANRFANLTAWLPDQAIAVKLVGAFPNNVRLKPPIPNLQGIVALFDGRDGRPLMTADGTALTYIKTAADSALGADILARLDPRTLLLVGAGGLAPHVIAAHRAVRPSIERVIVWNRNRDKAEQVLHAIADRSAEFLTVATLDEAIAEADIVSTVTSSEEPLVRGKLLKAGAHVDLIGSYQPEMRESDDDVLLRAGRVYMDTRKTYDRTGDLIQPMNAGVIDRDYIAADLFELCSGKASGRKSDQEITVFKNIGGGHLDLFVAMDLFKRFNPSHT